MSGYSRCVLLLGRIVAIFLVLRPASTSRFRSRIRNRVPQAKTIAAKGWSCIAPGGNTFLAFGFVLTLLGVDCRAEIAAIAAKARSLVGSMSLKKSRQRKP